MGYATKQNLIDRFGEKELIELTDRATPAAGAIDDQVLGRALADADARINAFLAPRYTLPIDPVPASLEPVACDIARYYLYEDRVTDQVKRRYDDAVAFLKAVANGTADIGVSTGNQAPASSGGPQVSAPDRIFTGETLADFTG